MDHCARCGHALGIGRFCTNCGHPVGQPVPPEDPLVDPTAPAPAPPADDLPEGPRYPLYADELEPTTSTWVGPRSGAGRSRSGVLPFAAAGLALVLAVLVGVNLLGGDDSDDPATPANVATPSSGVTESADPSEPLPSPSIEPGAEGDVAGLATPTVPDTAEPSLDVDGNTVRYDAFNMLDGVAETAWRVPGDATGEELVFELREPTLISKLGLINGYAKREPGYDGYPSNRRIRAVEWVLDDGTVLSQRLGKKRRKMQTIPVDAVLTTTVRLRLIAVSRPGRGAAGRDYTAISDVSIVGMPV
ncbi:MAG: hypothetical protein WB767_00405 [Nocardioides sp.]